MLFNNIFVFWVLMSLSPVAWAEEKYDECITCKCVEIVGEALWSEKPSLPESKMEKQFCSWAKEGMADTDKEIVHDVLKSDVSFAKGNIDRMLGEEFEKFLNDLSEGIQNSEGTDLFKNKVKEEWSANLLATEISLRSLEDAQMTRILSVGLGFYPATEGEILPDCKENQQVCIFVMNTMRLDNIGYLKTLDRELGIENFIEENPTLSNSIFYMIVHAAGLDIKFQQNFLPTGKRLVQKGLLEGKRFAQLTDKIEYSTTKTLIYGTQYRCTDGVAVSSYPIVDEVNIDKRRAEIGLGPWAELNAKHNEICKASQ